MTKRFKNALTKLYNSYSRGDLNAMDCKMCAVGNLCDNNPIWDYVIVTTATREEGLIDQTVINSSLYSLSAHGFNEGIKLISKTNYSVLEIAKVERIFLHETIASEQGETEETQLNGLFKVLDYLASLDNIDWFSFKDDFSSKVLDTEHLILV